MDLSGLSPAGDGADEPLIQSMFDAEPQIFTA